MIVSRYFKLAELMKCGGVVLQRIQTGKISNNLLKLNTLFIILPADFTFSIFGKYFMVIPVSHSRGKLSLMNMLISNASAAW